jgi:hypothetical protein
MPFKEGNSRGNVILGQNARNNNKALALQVGEPLVGLCKVKSKVCAAHVWVGKFKKGGRERGKIFMIFFR